MIRFARLPLVLGLILFAGALTAQTTPRYDDGITGAELEVLIGQAMQIANVSGEVTVSERRAYPPCGSRPEVSPKKGSWSLVTLHCASGRGWTRHIRTTVKPARYVSTRAEPQPAAEAPLVATLVRPLKKGTVITAQDITLAALPRGSAEGTFDDPAALIGQRLSQNLGSGRAVQARHLQKRWMITKDMPVSIQLDNSIVTITAPGISLSNGELGDMISVRNLSSGTVLQGQVSGPQKITVRAKTY